MILRSKTFMHTIAMLGILVFSARSIADQTLYQQPTSSDAVMIMSPWVRAAPPTARVMAGYATLHNQSDQAQTLTGVSSPMFERIEIHESYVEGGISKMRQLPQLEIAANAMATFAPNGRHLMLIGPTADVKRAVRIEMTFIFADGSRKSLDVDVLKRGNAATPMQQHNH
tara:strand:- start:52452 stop:52961 length:510 start_codon:yes stop_codon:yes gene_type:complete